MSKKDVVIKPTYDGRVWAMGLVVDSIDEALQRCERKAPGKNIFLEYPPEPFVTREGKDMTATFAVCGGPEYIKEWYESISSR